MGPSKKTIVQINVESNFGSTGKISENLSNHLINADYNSIIAHGPIYRESNSTTIKIGTKIDYYTHILSTRIFDKHGLASIKATKIFLSNLKDLKPDIIHLHNIHGYYINYELLFQFLKSVSIPVIWTLHDCWAFTGHCAHFEYISCEKWKTECNKCPLTHTYPKSWFTDRSSINFNQKKNAFSNLNNLTLVPVSNWLASKIKDSFLYPYPIKTITNGIDTNTFKPVSTVAYTNKKNWTKFSIILGVASVWDTTKGWEDFIKMAALLKKDERIVLIGLSKKQINQLPKNIIGLERTESKDELIQLYSIAKVFMNLTYADTYPTTNLESLACGTPVITYNTGGSVEEIRNYNGKIVNQGDFESAYNTFAEMKKTFKSKNTLKIRKDVLTRLDKTIQLKKYDELYHSLLIDR